MLAQRFRSPADVTVTPGRTAGVDVERIEPPGAGTGLVVHVHGGAYVQGSLATIRPFAVALARASASTVLTLDYRLAPEHPFPAGLDDVVAVWDAVAHQHAGGAVALCGDSAGGGLALAAALQLRRTRAAQPRAVALISPWVDLTGRAGSWRARRRADWILRADELDWAARAYAGPVPRDDPRVSPLFDDPTGLPPLLVTVGTHEILLDDGVRLAEHASTAGVDVTLEISPGMPHVWQLLGSVLPEADDGIARVGRFLGDALRRATPGS